MRCDCQHLIRVKNKKYIHNIGGKRDIWRKYIPAFFFLQALFFPSFWQPFPVPFEGQGPSPAPSPICLYTAYRILFTLQVPGKTERLKSETFSSQLFSNLSMIIYSCATFPFETEKNITAILRAKVILHVQNFNILKDHWWVTLNVCKPKNKNTVKSHLISIRYVRRVGVF